MALTIASLERCLIAMNLLAAQPSDSEFSIDQGDATASEQLLPLASQELCRLATAKTLEF